MHNQRRDLLRQYIVACLKDSALSWADVANPAVFIEKLVVVISKDSRVILKELGREGLSAVLQMGAAMLGAAGRQK